MGKRIIQQARGKGSLTYRVRRKAFSVRPKYPKKIEGEWEVVKIFSSAGHSTPIAKLRQKNKVFEYFAGNLLYEGQKINFNGKEKGDIGELEMLKIGDRIFNIENNPGDGGKFVKSGGNFAEVLEIKNDNVVLLMPSKKQKVFNKKCRATIGVASGQGRIDKPILKAGKKYYVKKAKSKLWPRTSAVKMNAVDHPFGGGRGKRIKSKIIQRFASPGQKVGLIRPKRTGKRK